MVPSSISPEPLRDADAIRARHLRRWFKRPAALRIPQELFKRIVTHVAHDSRNDPAPASEKREVARCALVCRYWAAYCRGPLFSKLTLRCAADAHQLLEFATVSTLGHSVTDFVELIILVVSLPAPPWVHLILCKTLRELRMGSHDPRLGDGALTPAIDVRISSLVPETSSTVTRQCAPRSIFHDLPRTLPVTIDAMFPLDATLAHMHFAAYSDLIRFAASWAPCTAYEGAITLAHVTWDGMDAAQPSEPPPPRSLARSPNLYVDYIHAKDCTAVWPLLWLLIATRRPPRPPRDGAYTAIFVRGESACHAAELVQAVFDGCRCALCTQDPKKGVELCPTSFADNHRAGDPVLAVKHEDNTHCLELFLTKDSGDVATVRLTLMLEDDALDDDMSDDDIADADTSDDGMADDDTSDDNTSNDDGLDAGGLPASPEALQFPWQVFGKQVSKFDPSPVVQVILPEGTHEYYRPFIQAETRLVQDIVWELEKSRK
ncbi:hypothetical protein PsYK624_128710 [Phanerochaete sordida]|uniref:F-box domain-containing protein n=1 Tax=Phanerochaete sordida TaxID=48140 RepID=A0A9P3LJH2_9APHY|nr:hypothetical protein PsYK624_128710 [Phanerochaete sordida]